MEQNSSLSNTRTPNLTSKSKMKAYLVFGNKLFKHSFTFFENFKKALCNLSFSSFDFSIFENRQLSQLEWHSQYVELDNQSAFEWKNAV